LKCEPWCKATEMGTATRGTRKGIKRV